MIDGAPVSVFDRRTVCIGGLPFDVLGMSEAIERIHAAIADRRPLFLSTPNLNFLMTAMRDAAFRDSVIHSEMSVADGMPLVWIARLLGFPIPERVAGATLFSELWHGRAPADGKPVRVYFFGGPPGVAERAGQAINAASGNMRCVGHCSPGFGSIEEMSSASIIEAINLSGADFLVVSLGAKKGQAWIERNRARLNVPVLSHLGAVVNFVAGTVNRAPLFWQRNGLEWLWRIKEEPSLLKRYLIDGLGMMRFLAQRVLPYALWLRVSRCLKASDGAIRVVSGAEGRYEVLGRPGEVAMQEWRGKLALLQPDSRVVLDFSGATSLPPEFFSLFLMLVNMLGSGGGELLLEGISASIRHHFYWNGLESFIESGGAK